jgi:hypothetical protein
MKFDKAKRLTMTLVILGLVLCVLAAILGEDGSLFMILLIGGVVVFLAGMVVCFTWCRCPHCNHVIVRKLMVLEVCPFCKHDLITGLKRKKNGK